jgi:phenylalanyl-tRNA synthetase beta chain
MIVSIDWIKEFVSLPQMDPKTLGEKFTLATCEVEGIESFNQHLREITVVEVTKIEPHPNAEKLKLVSFTNGDDTMRVVCGAPNVVVSMKVPFAPIGLTLPGGFTLTPKEIRGVLSEGMLCSETELEVGDDDSGLMKLASDAQLGQSLLEYLKEKEDILLDIDNKSITHRPDLWGHFGMAREFSAIFRTPLKEQYSDSWKAEMRSRFSKDESPVKVIMEGKSAGLAYWGISVDGIKVTTSPEWMQRRLRACGLRPINSIVDISNYVMLETGMPNHIFDRDQIEEGKIIIRKAGADEEFITLDEQTRILQPEDTVVADGRKALVIAGIMGGLESGVTESTSRIFIESANWVDSLVRKTSTRIGLRTDSSQRYEKCLDSQLTETGLLRVLELVLELHPGSRVIGRAEYAGVDLQSYEDLQIQVHPQRLRTQLGYDLSNDEMKEILNYLDFQVEENSDGFMVTVPSYRATKDVECEADILEELGRIIGYDNIQPVSPMDEILPVRLQYPLQLLRKISDFMVYRAGAAEVHTYPLVGKQLLQAAQWPDLNEELVIVNALSKDHDRMRPSMVPSMLNAVQLNQKHFDSFSFFELGRFYQPAKGDDFSQEHNCVAYGCFSRNENRFIEMREHTEGLLASLNLPFKMMETRGANPLLPKSWPGVHPHEALDVMVMGKPMGILFTVHPIILRKMKIKGQLQVFLLNLSQIEKKELKDKTNYKPLPKFPGSSFDWTVVAEKTVPAESLIQHAKSTKIADLTDVKIADVFTMETGEHAVTLRAFFQNQDKTLGGEEIQAYSEALVKALESKGFPLK